LLSTLLSGWNVGIPSCTPLISNAAVFDKSDLVVLFHSRPACGGLLDWEVALTLRWIHLQMYRTTMAFEFCQEPHTRRFWNVKKNVLTDVSRTHDASDSKPQRRHEATFSCTIGW
jgi:hypothetical protein